MIYEIFGLIFKFFLALLSYAAVIHLALKYFRYLFHGMYYNSEKSKGGDNNEE